MMSCHMPCAHEVVCNYQSDVCFDTLLPCAVTADFLLLLAMCECTSSHSATLPTPCNCSDCCVAVLKELSACTQHITSQVLCHNLFQNAYHTASHQIRFCRVLLLALVSASWLCLGCVSLDAAAYTPRDWLYRDLPCSNTTLHSPRCS